MPIDDIRVVSQPGEHHGLHLRDGLGLAGLEHNVPHCFNVLPSLSWPHSIMKEIISKWSLEGETFCEFYIVKKFTDKCHVQSFRSSKNNMKGNCHIGSADKCGILDQPAGTPFHHLLHPKQNKKILMFLAGKAISNIFFLKKYTFLLIFVWGIRINVNNLNNYKITHPPPGSFI